MNSCCVFWSLTFPLHLNLISDFFAFQFTQSCFFKRLTFVTAHLAFTHHFKSSLSKIFSLYPFQTRKEEQVEKNNKGRKSKKGIEVFFLLSNGRTWKIYFSVEILFHDSTGHIDICLNPLDIPTVLWDERDCKCLRKEKSNDDSQVWIWSDDFTDNLSPEKTQAEKQTTSANSLTYGHITMIHAKLCCVHQRF